MNSTSLSGHGEPQILYSITQKKNIFLKYRIGSTKLFSFKIMIVVIEEQGKDEKNEEKIRQQIYSSSNDLRYLLNNYQEGFYLPAAVAVIKAAKASALRVWRYTVPGPVNLQTRPSPELMPDMSPPEATRSRMYLQFQATRWPLSTMYFSPSAIFIELVLVFVSFKEFHRDRMVGLDERERVCDKDRERLLTSFLIIAPKL